MLAFLQIMNPAMTFIIILALRPQRPDALTHVRGLALQEQRVCVWRNLWRVTLLVLILKHVGEIIPSRVDKLGLALGVQR